DMGPGYVPRALAWILMGFGLAFAASGLRGKHRSLPRFDLRSFLMVLLSLAVFALLLPKGGLALATFATLACSTFAVSDFRWRESLLFAVVLTAFTVLLFVNGLGLPLAVWPRW
ncbi:MAG: tripartite tricarboxylate transporter TctB family protein, partial [candidate division NC10 bacterium]|nr:tripartite tricarboxylate transporter TctB family protein [candidate division NC10 bacterium]